MLSPPAEVCSRVCIKCKLWAAAEGLLFNLWKKKKRPVCAAGQSYWCDKIAQFHFFAPLCFPDKNALSLSQSHMCADHLIWLYKTEKQLVVNASSIKLSPWSPCVDLLCGRYKVQSKKTCSISVWNVQLLPEKNTLHLISSNYVRKCSKLSHPCENVKKKY